MCRCFVLASFSCGKARASLDHLGSSADSIRSLGQPMVFSIGFRFQANPNRVPQNTPNSRGFPPEQKKYRRLRGSAARQPQGFATSISWCRTSLMQRPRVECGRGGGWGAQRQVPFFTARGPLATPGWCHRLHQASAHLTLSAQPVHEASKVLQSSQLTPEPLLEMALKVSGPTVHSQAPVTEMLGEFRLSGNSPCIPGLVLGAKGC